MIYISYVQVAELASLAQLLPPRSPTVRNPAPDSSLYRLQSCSPIASASAAARRLRPRFMSAAAPGPDCGIRFNCCSPLPPLPAAAPRLRPLHLLLAACIRFSCCSRSRPLRLPRLRLLQLLLPDYVRFDCCSPLALAGFQPMPDPFAKFSNILRGVRGSVNKLKYEGRASL